MKSLILHSHEIQALKASGKVLVVRPCKDQSSAEYVFLDKRLTVPSGETYTGWAKHITALSILVPTKCPLGAPSERRWVKETWRIGAWCESDGCVAIDYISDGYSRKQWIDVPDDDVFNRLWIESTDDAARVFGPRDRYKWKPGESPCRVRSASTMPQWASRFTVQVDRVEVRKIKSLCLEDSVAAGFVGRFICPSPELCRDIENCNHDSEYHFMLDWNSRYAKRFAFDADPWAWFAWVEMV